MVKLKKNLFYMGIPVTLLFFGGCQNKQLIEKKTPFSSNIIRLGDTVIAEVDGTSIFFSDVEAQALANGALQPNVTLSVDDPLFRSTLDELIDQRLLALEALRQSLDQKDSTRRRLGSMRERILANVLVEDLLAKNITDESLHRLYDEQAYLRDRSEQVRAHIIKVKTQADAEAIEKRLAAGESFHDLAKEYSTDISSGDIGGDLGYFTETSIDPAIAKVAFAQENSEISPPFQVQDQWVIVQTTARRPTPQPKFEDISDKIRSFMTLDEVAREVENLRTRSEIQLMLGNARSEAGAAQTAPKNDSEEQNKPDANVPAKPKER